MYENLGKPILDYTVVLIVLVLCIVPAIIVTGLILVTMGRPILFTQFRIRKDDVPFEVYKFRTMRNLETDKQNVPSANRITRLGHFLRKTSLDEIPQLINILKQDMSLVGPRPLLVDYLPLYTPFQRKRHSVHPGITGLAQVSGRSRLSWQETFNLDVKYVESISLFKDLKIIFQTVYLVLLSRDTMPNDNPIKERFNGKN